MLLSTTEGLNFQVSETKICNSHSKKLLEVTFHKKFKINICPEATRKLNALARLTPFIELEKRRMLINAIFKSQFNYCPVVWGFQS